MITFLLVLTLVSCCASGVLFLRRWLTKPEREVALLHKQCIELLPGAGYDVVREVLDVWKDTMLSALEEKTNQEMVIQNFLEQIHLHENHGRDTRGMSQDMFELRQIHIFLCRRIEKLLSQLRADVLFLQRGVEAQKDQLALANALIATLGIEEEILYSRRFNPNSPLHKLPFALTGTDLPDQMDNNSGEIRVIQRP